MHALMASDFNSWRSIVPAFDSAIETSSVNEVMDEMLVVRSHFFKLF